MNDSATVREDHVMGDPALLMEVRRKRSSERCSLLVVFRACARVVCKVMERREEIESSAGDLAQLQRLKDEAAKAGDCAPPLFRRAPSSLGSC
jgi:hypothetical protein